MWGKVTSWLLGRPKQPPESAPPAPRDVKEEIAWHYSVGPHFTDALLEHLIPDGRAAEFESLDEFLALPEPDRTYFDYAFSSNLRGTALSRYVSDRLDSNPARYLDVGCGLGGAVVAFAREGTESIGIELDPSLVALARKNCEDVGVHAQIVQGDVLDEGAVEGLGRFDVVTFMDVIEHVLDVEVALTRLFDLLRPGGSLFLEIPNREFLGYVAHDPHYQRPGLVLLGREEAIEFHSALVGGEYGVGDFFPLEHYLGVLSGLGASPEQLLPGTIPDRSLTDFPTLREGFDSEWETFQADHLGRLPANVRASLDHHVRDYLDRLDRQYEAVRDSEPSEAAFLNSYMRECWTVRAVKPVHVTG